jgi:adenylate kinase family enzyme
MQRIMVVGSSGAGKTTLANSLAEKLRLPVIHLDTHYWLPGWKAPSGDGWRQRMEGLADGPEWILDGNFAESFQARMSRADTMIWLDYPRLVCMRRIFARAIRDRGKSRPDLPPGCPEQLDLPTLRFAWEFARKTRPLIVEGIARFGQHLRVTRLANDRETAAFLAMVAAA